MCEMELCERARRNTSTRCGVSPVDQARSKGAYHCSLLYIRLNLVPDSQSTVLYGMPEWRAWSDNCSLSQNGSPN